ncbi:histone-lysine N-methyltransferase eggless isoform X2 [Ischnura elegans]|uniref:histone-lysine N-methyltransferase eggless isoform X2 n=1 Tax=Ischnura elegans TaxID=197161 RepID=UPI001ED88C49|nr:histone-lysine N-methyltransferase eggless isoform X2 [Ischnura elegans]
MENLSGDIKTAQKGEWMCCNSYCNSKSTSYTIAPKVVTKYFQVHAGKRKQYVCDVCLQEYVEHTQNMAKWLLEKKPLFRFPLPEQKETVVIDSDDEESDEDGIYPEDIPMEIEDDLKEVFDEVISKIDLKNQYSSNIQVLVEDMEKLNEKLHEEVESLNNFQREVDALRDKFYAAFEPQRKELPPVEIIDDDLPSGSGRITPRKLNAGPGVAMKRVTQVHRNTLDALTNTPVGGAQPEVEIEALGSVSASAPVKLPPPGVLERPRPKVGDIVHVMKNNHFGVWSKARIHEILERETECFYRIKYEQSYRKGQQVKIVTGRQMAYSYQCPTRIPVGTRVIAIFREDENSNSNKVGMPKESYYCGVTAENPRSTNNFRYLIFFDDGYAQYVRHEKILVVCESSPNVWEDIHADSRGFVKKYLEAYPERPMVRLNTGHVLRTEWNGKWWVARVLQVDGSLVHLHFDADGRTEWIYRGSTRLGPLYTEFANANARSQNIGNFNRSRGPGIASLKKMNLPYVEYTRGNEMEQDPVTAGQKGDRSSTPIKDDVPAASPPVVRAVARKSTTNQRRYEERAFEYAAAYSEDKFVKYEKNLPVNLKTLVAHRCGPKCLEDYPYPQECTKGKNPLAKPLLCGWIRSVVRHRGGTKRVVLYTAPCGRRLRNLVELHSYLRVTKSSMPIDLFDFDFWVHCLAEYTVVKQLSYIKDISYGKEKVPIPAVNWIDYSFPDFVEYSTVRIPTSGVHLNLDTDFLVCCDCDDDCQDKEKCACWQLTIQGTRCGPTGMADPTVGYLYKRLPEAVTTGIYECNSRCKCKETCLNRVAQLPLQQRLQVFRTRNRGWGVQCLSDIPQGAFICVYVGQLLTEAGANEDGKAYGDEYLAELDYIEVVERIKEGYESDVLDDMKVEPVPPATPPPKVEQVKPPPPPFPVQHVKEVVELDESKSEGESDDDNDREDEETGDTEDSGKVKGHKNSYSVDEDFKTSTRLELTPTDLSIRSRLRKRTSKQLDESDSTKDDEIAQRQPSKFSAEEPQSCDREPPAKSKYRSVREVFGPGEYCYIMDAKSIGNVGRYLNHSCSPNVFVQNVFVDSHDLRFPWVAFFALTYITAGTELTWDYNYDVGSVPGKVMYCYCGASDCRGRLL